MKKENTTSAGGIGLVGLTFVAFLILKLCKVINWSWWWVFSPFWLSGALVIAFVVLYMIIMAKNLGKSDDKR